MAVWVCFQYCPLPSSAMQWLGALALNLREGFAAPPLAMRSGSTDFATHFSFYPLGSKDNHPYFV